MESDPKEAVSIAAFGQLVLGFGVGALYTVPSSHVTGKEESFEEASSL